MACYVMNILLNEFDDIIIILWLCQAIYYQIQVFYLNGITNYIYIYQYK